MSIYVKNHKPYLSVITDEFNGRSSSWWSKYINTMGEIKSFSNRFDKRWIFRWILGTDKLTNSYTSCSCTDIIFKDQPSMSVNSEVHAFLHWNCQHHQIFHASFNLIILIYYLPLTVPMSDTGIQKTDNLMLVKFVTS